MMNDRIRELLSEHNLEIDDIRWYLSWSLARELQSFRDRNNELVAEIWSGRLADRLYEMEDRFLSGLGERLEQGVTDESSVRSFLQEAKACQRRRRGR